MDEYIIPKLTDNREVYSNMQALVEDHPVFPAEFESREERSKVILESILNHCKHSYEQVQRELVK